MGNTRVCGMYTTAMSVYVVESRGADGRTTCEPASTSPDPNPIISTGTGSEVDTVHCSKRVEGSESERVDERVIDTAALQLASQMAITDTNTKTQGRWPRSE